MEETLIRTTSDGRGYHTNCTKCRYYFYSFDIDTASNFANIHFETCRVHFLIIVRRHGEANSGYVTTWKCEQCQLEQDYNHKFYPARHCDCKKMIHIKAARCEESKR